MELIPFGVDKKVQLRRMAFDTDLFGHIYRISVHMRGSWMLTDYSLSDTEGLHQHVSLQVSGE